jgi:Zn-dependent M28 family amino/carboxypeptidase
MKNALNRAIIFQVFCILILCSTTMADESTYPPLVVNVANLRKTVEYLTSIRPHRSFTHQESLNIAASFIEQHFHDYGLTTELQTFEATGNIYANVIGTMGANRAERVVVGAHYDVCGEQPGADDNASAVAGLLEVSRLLNHFASTLDYQVDFVAYTLEEPPFFGTPKMGSYVHAQSLHEAGVKVRGMICLEMIGFFTNDEDSQEYPLPIMRLFYPSRGNFIGVVGNFRSRALVKEVRTHMDASQINVESLSAPAIIPGINFSDHGNYWEFGYPAVMVTDTAFFRNPHYHEVSDVPETLDFDTMKEVVKGIAWTVLNL